MKQIIAIVLIVFFFSGYLFAHPGRTAGDGCHFCKKNCEKWGVKAGERHCH